MNTAYIIEQSVPLPGRRGGLNAQVITSDYPLQTMKVKDSFAIPYNKQVNQLKQAAQLRSVITWWVANHNSLAKFAIRRLPEEIRVWRTA